MAEAVVFFDGMCGFCDRSVTFLFARDKQHLLRFAALQGETAKRLLPEPLRQDLATMVLVKGGVTYTKSTAALRSIATVGGLWRSATLLLAIPKWIRDGVYGVVVKHRYQIFGKNDACRLPSPTERAYFLD